MIENACKYTKTLLLTWEKQKGNKLLKKMKQNFKMKNHEHVPGNIQY